MDTSYILGRKPVLEALSLQRGKVEQVLIKKPVPRNLEQVIETCRKLGIRFRLVAGAELDKAGRCHQGVAAIIRAVSPVAWEDVLSGTPDSAFPVILALDQVQDPGNLGTLARTMAAFGGSGIVIPKDRSALPGTGAMKSSAGALARINMVQVTNMARALDLADEQGFTIYGAVPDQGLSVFDADFSFPAVLVLGGEQKGIRPNVLKRCQEKIHIPMPGGFDSLNVAQAGAVILGQMLKIARP
ncbi:TrmH family RNA methyltransferase [Desulfonatronovibrio hydrogenovorans]|uniref:TrmH family RNA methyltransferase n=1 Tax=Desulfonatronovibrio hydrogenovorans TaxID=53245 RepID=UPI00054F321C|nr:RNA methyltransferase [Desulfonatronovibrio hydrogenovorans]